MYRKIYVVSLITLLLLSSGFDLGILRAGVPYPLQSAAIPNARFYNHPTSDCPVTEPIKGEPPKDPNADSFGLAFWYVNADRTIWVKSESWVARRGHKVIWIRPQGTQLKVSGHRLDAKGPPLDIRIPCCYPTGFQVTGMKFPTEGCWEVSAKAGKSELRFVTTVGPPKYKSSYNRK